MTDTISRTELEQAIGRGDVTVLEALGRMYFEDQHLPGARNVPFESLEAMRAELKNLSKGRRIYAYCRGPYCLIAVEGVRKLRAAGVAAQRLAFSVPEWQVAQRAGALDLFGPGKRPGEARGHACRLAGERCRRRQVDRALRSH